MYEFSSLFRVLPLISFFILLTACGGSDSSSLNVSQDTVAPVITLNGDSVINLWLGEDYIELGASALDNKDGIVSVAIDGTVNTSLPNVHLVTYSAADKANNSATLTRSVIVTERPDNQPPVITLNGEPESELKVGETYVELGALAVDEIDGSLAVEILGTVDSSRQGQYTLVYSATDSSNNTAWSLRKVNVVVPDVTPL